MTTKVLLVSAVLFATFVSIGNAKNIANSNKKKAVVTIKVADVKGSQIKLELNQDNYLIKHLIS